MVAAAPIHAPAPPGRAPVVDDQRITLYGVTWDQYRTIDDAFPDEGPRMAYLEGTLEIMTTGPTHERIKKTLARLIEVYADEMNVELYGYGHTTFRKEAAARGAEPDECYTVDGELREGGVPELAVEVVISHGAIDKLSIHAGLRVPEVWFWENGVITVHVLGAGGYEATDQSELFPDLFVPDLARFVLGGPQPHMVRAFREYLRERSSGPR